MNSLTKKILSLTAASFLIISVFFTLYIVFMVVPNEKIMGPVQRIFYFHVGSAVACYVAFAIVFAASIGFLATREEKYDIYNVAAGEVGFLFCTITMITGMIWGNAAWNTPFQWEPRLVTFLLLWLIFLTFTTLRIFADPSLVRTHSAVIGILGALLVPVVWYSVKLLPASFQLHPQVVENRGLKDVRFYYGMFSGMLSMIALELYLIWIRVRLGIAENKSIKSVE